MCRRNGSEFAYPSTSVYVESTPESEDDEYEPKLKTSELSETKITDLR